MARLTLQVGQATVFVETSDANATTILHHYADAKGLPDDVSALERLQLVANELAQHVSDTAKDREIIVTVRQRQAEMVEQLKGRNWRNA